MRRMTLSIAASAVLASSVLLVEPAWSLAITCGGDERTATLSSAEACETGLGNPKLADILGAYPSEPWTKLNELTGNGTSGYLTASLTSGSWGSSSISGTWAIDPSFWSLFDEAVLSIHVGNGNGDPDFFAWLITPNTTSGLWSYADLDGKGGGLSNLKLWGRGEGTPVPEPATLSLLGTGVLLVALGRRRVGKQPRR